MRSSDNTTTREQPGRYVARVVVAALLALVPSQLAFAQNDGRVYAGALAGVSTLSADGQALTQPDGAEASQYKPENGPALNLFVGVPLGRYLTVQANYVWNRNELTLFSAVTSAAGGRFYEQNRDSSQHAVIGDSLLYFRPRGNSVRPYLSAGVGSVRFASESPRHVIAGGLPPPAGAITSTRVLLRVAVGIDLALGDQWSFRYSFSESISGNPISERLTPPAERNLANFQNLFGIIRYF
jgi:hypothetical protein